ncbi:hypothetical protein P12x_001266 [Tundrisphaera lichenicola]|uniref:hypothetical protein n=1 Tax=Tundrisphaera lichenicola TaxID=2029860 RepID=UPI003EBEBFFE
MKLTWRIPALAASAALVGMFGPQIPEAKAQIPVYSTESVFKPTAPVVTGPTYVVPSEQTSVIPTRRVLRNHRRYSVLRPNYGGSRPALSFAPFSDQYQSRFTAPQPTYYVVPRR